MSKLAIEGGTPVRSDYLVFGSPRIEAPEIEEVVAAVNDGRKARLMGSSP